MKRLILTLILLTTLKANLYAQNLSLNVYPYNSEKELFLEYQPLIQHLEQALNTKITFSIAKNYQQQIELLQHQQTHIAILGPYNYTLAKKAIPNLHYLATRQHFVHNKISSSYQSIIVASKKSNIKGLNDLKNKRFGFTDKNSTSGYILPSRTLKDININKNDFKQYFMLKAHNRLMEALSQNSIDAGATYYEIYEKYTKKYGNIYTILYKSKPIPYDPIVASGTLSQKMIEKISTAILRYKIEINDMKFNGFKKLDERTYRF